MRRFHQRSPIKKGDFPATVQLIAALAALPVAAEPDHSPAPPAVPRVVETDQNVTRPDDNQRAPSRHWAFQPVVRPKVPEPAPSARGAIDGFVLAKLSEHGLEPSPEADRRTLIRRLYFDLIGLPPTPEDVEAFLKDPSARAFETLVERLLASPHYGERWARHWLDVVRFAETHGFEMNQPRNNAWPYRDYVIRAFNEDKPYPDFVMEQLAGDSLRADEATGFIVGGPWDQVKSPDEVLTRNQRADELHDMVNTTGSAFLGLTVGCARCHDHKFDPIPQTDYYALAACFADVQHGERKLEPPDAARRQTKAARARARLAEIDAHLAAFEPLAFSGRTLVLDEEASAAGDALGIELMPRTAKGEYTAGTGRGERDDPGGVDRAPNMTPSYLAWNNAPGRDVFAYEPRIEGRFRIRLSWGCGWTTHARDAAYLLDRDGDLQTREDQVELARVDQQRFADGSGEVPNRPLWSGFRDAGAWDLATASKIVLRAGVTTAYVSTDVLALQEEGAGAQDESNGAPFLRAPVHPRLNVERFEPARARRVRFTIHRTSASEPCLDEWEVYTAESPPRNVALASWGTRARASGTLPNFAIHQLEHIHDGQYGNHRSWISDESGRGWIELEFPEEVTIDRMVWSRDREEKYSDRLATDYIIEAATDSNDWRRLVSSADRLPYRPNRAARVSTVHRGLAPADQEQVKALWVERANWSDALKRLTEAPTVYAGDFTEPGPTYLLNRGDPMQPREEIAPGGLSLLPTRFPLNESDDGKARRLALARWLADPANPLAPRVMVNRIWQHHFGEGLVRTPSDFGANGGEPSHPELLDWLAAEFVSNGWRMKAIHRLILTSSTYRQASLSRPEGLRVDSESRWLWRFPPRRLDAEPIRDAVLALSGTLDLRMGGPGFSFFQPNDNYVRVYNPKSEFTPEDWRRMIYGMVVRQRPDAVFGVFDCPDGGQIAPKRTRSTTPLQALNLLNSPFLMEQAGYFASRLESECGDNPPAQVRRAFALAFSRAPSPEEEQAAVALIQNQSLALFCRALLNANEFVHGF